MKNAVKKSICIVLMFIVMSLAITGCSTNVKSNESNQTPSMSMEPSIQPEEKKEVSYPMTVTDQIGREITIEKPVDTIVSSYYISTAIAIALGMEDALTGIEMKAESRGLYKLAAPRLLELPAIGSGKGINIEEIANLNPGVVILPKKLKDSVAQLEELNIPVIVVDPETLENYMDCVVLLGNVFGQQEKAKELVTYYTEKMEFVKTLTGAVTEKPNVYLGAGSSYLSTCTSKMYQNDMIAMAGGINVSSSLEDGYWAEVSPEHLLSWNPDYIFAVSYAEYTLEDIKTDQNLSEVTAVKEGTILTFPSSIEPWDYPTPSSVLGVLWLTHVLHEDLYSKEAYVTEATEFYSRFFGVEVKEEQLGIQ